MALDGVLSHFPVGVSFACAYGSAVFSQGAVSDADPTRLLDVLIAVDDPGAWHAANMMRHASHYPWPLRGRPALASWLQQRGGARMLFIPYAQVGSARCKYGVIATRDLLNDLLRWDTLYCAGRLHKPIRALGPVATAVSVALRSNEERALAVALWQLAVEDGARGALAYERVYTAIAELSYRGDVRMWAAEAPDKARRIVANNLDHFHALYLPHVEALERARILTSDARTLTLVDRDRLAARVTQLPSHTRAHLSRIVLRTSAAQTLKGVLSAGPANALVYAWRKVGKRFGK